MTSGWRQRGSVIFLRRFFLSQSTEKFHEGSPQAVVLKTSEFEKYRKKGGTEGVSRFSDENFFLLVPKILVEVIFSISPFSGIENG